MRTGKKIKTGLLAALFLPLFLFPPGTQAFCGEKSLHRAPQVDSLQMEERIRALQEALSSARDSVKTLQARLHSGQGETGDLRKQIEEKDRRIRALVKDSTSFSKTIDKLSAKVDKAGVKDMEARITQLEKDIADASRASAATLALKDSVIASLEGELERRDKLLSDMGAFKDVFVSKVLSDGKSYLEKPFSQMDTLYMQEVIHECGVIQDNSDIAALGSSFTDMLGKKLSFDTLSEKVSSPLGREELEGAKALCSELLSGCPSPQQPEVKALDDAFSKYDKALGYLQGIMKEIQSVLEPYRSRTDNIEILGAVAKEDIDMVLSKEGNQYYRDKVFAAIPFFRKAYADYVKELGQSPHEVPSIEKLVIEMNL